MPMITHPLLWIIMHNGQHISAHLSSCCRSWERSRGGGSGRTVGSVCWNVCRVIATISPGIFVACHPFSISHLCRLSMLDTKAATPWKRRDTKKRGVKEEACILVFRLFFSPLLHLILLHHIRGHLFGTFNQILNWVTLSNVRFISWGNKTGFKMTN